MKTKIKKWITFLFLASMLTIAYVTPTKAQYLPDEYTVGLWHLDKEFGTALSFDGINDYVEVPDDPSLDFGTGDFTIEAWIKMPPVTHRNFIVAKDVSSTTGIYYFEVGYAGGNVALEGKLGVCIYETLVPGWTGRYVRATAEGTDVDDNQWHHVVMVVDRSDEIRIFVDGREEPTEVSLIGIGVALADINVDSTADLCIGRNERLAAYFDGFIDEVRVSNVARTSFNLFAPLTVDSDTVALWHFDDDPGQSAYDATDNGNDGRLGYTGETDDNDPTWVDSTLAIDSSSNENFGTIHGAAWADAEFGEALYFDGVDDYVEVPDSDSLDVTGPITLEAWIKRMESKYQTVLAKWRIGDVQRSYLLALTADNKVRFWLSPDGTWPNRKELTSSTTVGTEWTHIMLTWNGTTMKIFINGVEDLSTQSAEISIFEGTAKLTMGKYEDYTIHPPCYFKGLIDEVHISNVARAPVDIDIMPGSDPNSICLSKQGLLPVAILSTDNFDATQIDPGTLALGGVAVSERGGGKKKSPKLAFSIEDVDEDGDLDMMAFFSVPELVDNGLDSTTTALELTGFLTDGTYIKGIDSVRIVPE